MTSPFVAGQKLRVSDLTGGTGGSGASVGGGIVRMSADATTVNNSTSFTDTGLTLAVVANAVYALEAWVRYTSIAAADFKIQPSSPSGTTGRWAMVGYGRDVAPAADTGLGGLWITADIGSALTVAGDSTGTLDMSCKIDGSFATTAAGNFLLRYGQRSATVSNTIARSGSWMRLTRIA